ncbi:unnamed protein product [Notodromas monacha]|uniref:Uncharacterized protein n=1 Tax=Notodromas monacha TaxID=399045 RepID=A0A7R9BHG5_9CRUS|nr:unnamed protein product [Notodromas monacha]CAG0914148.1 unnamed protein product [Notodromas monacha]
MTAVTRGKRKLAKEEDETCQTKKIHLTDKYIMWPSSLMRAGHTKVEINSTDPTHAAVIQNIHDEFGIHVGRGVQLPCKLFPSSKFRNGRERFWCPVHQGSYGKIAQVNEANSTGIRKCDQVHDLIDIVRDSEIPVFDLGDYLRFSVSIGLPPSVNTVEKNNVVGLRIHAEGKEEVINKVFPAVYIKKIPKCLFSYSGKGLLITPPAALEAFMQMEAANVGKEDQSSVGHRVPVTLTEVVQCKHCKSLHEDVGDFFGQNYHKKHLCGCCGREIFGKPNIGNPLGIFVKGSQPSQAEASGRLVLDTSKHKFMLWPTVRAFFSNSLESTLQGVRVKLFDAEGNDPESDKTYGSIEVDGQAFNRRKAMQVMLDGMQGTENHIVLENSV